VADAELGADPAKTMRRMIGGLQRPGDKEGALRMIRPGSAGFVERLREPDRLPDWISAQELDHYINEFTRTGFTGGLNWYRNLDRNWEIMTNPAVATVAAPAMFVAGVDDPVLGFTRRDRAAEVVTGPYREVMILSTVKTGGELS
jgi:hypothetical protein